MAQSTDVAAGESATADGTEGIAVPLTVRVIGVGMGAGLLGMIAMLPVLVGVPVALGVFRTAPIAEFVPVVGYFGIEPTFAMGVTVFVAGGTVLWPTLFLVVGAYLPPKTPRYLRGVSYGTIFWTGFAPALWPGGGIVTVGTFLIVSLVAHWIYGGVLAATLDRTIGIPQHDV